MPDGTQHVVGFGTDGGNDWFNRQYRFGAVPAAVATALINATALPAAPATWTPISAVTLGAATVAVYASSASGKINPAYVGVSMWKPTLPRTLQYVCSDVQTGNVTTTGLDRWGNLVSETVTLNGATVVHGTVAFEYVISFLVPTKAGSETFSAGTDTALGLVYKALNADAIVQAYTTATWTKDSGNGTVDATNQTWTPTTAPNGTRDYTILYRSIQ